MNTNWYRPITTCKVLGIGALHIHILAFLAVLSLSNAPASDMMELTLKDGRHLQGKWDAETGQLSFGGGTIHLNRDDVVDVKEVQIQEPKQALPRADLGDLIAEYSKLKYTLTAGPDEELARLKALKRVGARINGIMAVKIETFDIRMVMSGWDGSVSNERKNALNFELSSLRHLKNKAIRSSFYEGKPKAFGSEAFQPDDYDWSQYSIFSNIDMWLLYTNSRNLQLMPDNDLTLAELNKRWADWQSRPHPASSGPNDINRRRAEEPVSLGKPVRIIRKKDARDDHDAK